MSIARPSTTDLNLEAVEKDGNHSDTSSDETDRRRRAEKPNNGDNAAAAAVGRSYECTFCKRGFTNAQALGGHMNIHRKDKLKAKQKSNKIPQQQGSSKNSHHHQLYASSRNFTQIPTDQQRFYPSPRAQHVGYLFYPSYQQVVPPNDDCSNPGSLGLHGGLMDENLALRIGPQRREEDGEESKEELEKNEVDLELRLGHHKYS